MKVAVFETEQWEHEACLRLAPAHEVVCRRERLDTSTAALAHDAEVVSAFVNSDLSAAVLDQLPRLRLIATRSTGYDHIDLGRCAARGMAVANVPDYGDHTVAEHAFALLLAVSRRVVAAAERTRRGDFSQEGLRGFDLHGRTLGVVGTGRIGRRAIAIGRGFGMRVLAYDPRPEPAAAETLGFRYAPLEALLTEADVVTLHVPGGTSTRHLLSDAEFARMKPGAVLVNTARGSVVDAAALVRALDSGRLAGAGLDVLPEEPLVRDEAQIFRSEPVVGTERLHALLAGHALLRFPNVVITPHIAYDTDEALRRILDTTLANIEAFARGESLNLVPLPAAPS
jgi:D-lactate dehydrogenase